MILARFCHLLLGGIEEDLVHLLEDDNEVIKEGTLHILARAGRTIREILGVSSRSLDLVLERISAEGRLSILFTLWHLSQKMMVLNHSLFFTSFLRCVRDRVLDSKYVCAFLLDVSSSQSDFTEMYCESALDKLVSTKAKRDADSKLSEDAFDPAKSKNLYALCDVVMKRLASNLDELQDSSPPVALPPVLYKPLEKKEENDSLVGEQKTWLADEDILAHFESLELEANGIVHEDLTD
ncbi:hypothetical protein CASFOL_031599 [Castilleja foliolosa]|uniref:Uncharacterized protein n=1 Tax=Castilleja foliolosa TaxID=1961234 RepID=A0ABD3C6G3_9LAMI